MANRKLTFADPMRDASGSSETLPTVAPDAGLPTVVDRENYELSSDYLDLKLRLHRRLIDEINLSALDRLTPLETRNQISDVLREIIASESTPLGASETGRLVGDVSDEFLGYGPLEPLLKDPSIADIMVNTYNNVFVERRGQIERTAVKFKDDDHLYRIIERMVTSAGRRIDEGQPTVDARLADGSRINAVIPPIAVDGPLLSIRKFPQMVLDLTRLVELGAMPPSIASFLSAVVRHRLNILISGGTGSGKTTLLNALSGRINRTERIVTIEDAAELRIQQAHVVRLETRPPNIEGRGEIDQRHLVKNALRMRPDRIIVGEVRAGEAFDMLQAMNTGHHGSMTTIHANTPRDALRRLEQMIGMAAIDLPASTMRAQVASAIDVVIQVSRLPDGQRKIMSIQEVTGVEGDVTTLQEIMRFQQTGTGQNGEVMGDARMTGIVPNFVEDIRAGGTDIPMSFFTGDDVRF